MESVVKKFKRTLVHKFGSKLMFMLELQTCFKVVASILNSRPGPSMLGGVTEEEMILIICLL